MAKIKIPGNYFSITGEKNRTIHLQNPKSGLMTGRTDTNGKGDRTANLRVSKFFDINKNKKRDSNDLYPGQIVGRVGSGESKPSSLEVVKVREHTRNGKIEVKRHFRKIH
jgi:hypothetical protein